jgi:hypothetical protein
MKDKSKDQSQRFEDLKNSSIDQVEDEELLREERGRKFRVHCRWQALENKLDIFTPIGREDSRTR